MLKSQVCFFFFEFHFEKIPANRQICELPRDMTVPAPRAGSVAGASRGGLCRRRSRPPRDEERNFRVDRILKMKVKD